VVRLLGWKRLTAEDILVEPSEEVGGIFGVENLVDER